MGIPHFRRDDVHERLPMLPTRRNAIQRSAVHHQRDGIVATHQSRPVGAAVTATSRVSVRAYRWLSPWVDVDCRNLYALI